MSQQRPPPRVKFALLNPQGLTQSKMQDLLSWMKGQHVDMLLLLETQRKEDPMGLLRNTAGAGALWPGVRMHHCPGSGHTLGVTVVVGPTALLENVQRVAVEPDDSGRVVGLDFTVCGNDFRLLAVYGPAQTAQHARETFYRDTLRVFLPTDGRFLVIAGDLNCVVDRNHDCVYPVGAQLPQVNTRLAGSRELAGLMREFQLEDVWRRHHPGRREWTHWSYSHNSGARLDRWLVSALAGRRFLVTSDILPAACIDTDHRPVLCTLQLRDGQGAPQGTSYPSFPLLVLNIPVARERLHDMVQAEADALLAAPAGPGLITAWVNFKTRVLTRARELFRHHQRQRVQAAEQAEREARQRWAAVAFARPGQPFVGAFNAARLADIGVRSAWKQFFAPGRAAAANLEQLAADTSSYYFHAQAKAPPQPFVIRQLNRPGRQQGEPPDPVLLDDMAGVTEALGRAVEFYQSDSPFGLFRDRQVSTADQDALLAALPRKLSVDTAALAEGVDADGLLSAEELSLALSHARRGSAPGFDGLPYEFYRAFQDILLPVLVHVFNNGAFLQFGDNAPLAALLVGVICLVPKPGQLHEDLVSFRPITLLNCDIKLVMLVMSNRLQRPLDYLIDVTQSAFLRGRDISDNLRYHLGLAARLHELGLPGWLLRSDLTKAYDSVHRGWLLRVMDAMGFAGQGMVRWAKILLTGSTSMVRINGFLSAQFAVRSGLFQGSSLSCQEWVIVLQPLISYLNKLQHTGRVTSYALPSGAMAPLALAYADDTQTLVLHPDTEGPAVVQAFEMSARAGNPGISVPKSLLTHVCGNDIPPSLDTHLHAVHQATGWRMQPLGEPGRLLGVPYGGDVAACRIAAFQNVHGKMAAKAQLWRGLGLNQMGRAHVAGQAIAATAVFQFNFDRCPGPQLKEAQTILNNFVGASGRPEERLPYGGQRGLFPREDVAVLPADRGGMGLPVLEVRNLAMLAKTVWLIFRYTRHPWQQLFRNELEQAAPPAVTGRPAAGYHWVLELGTGVALPTGLRTPMLCEAVSAFAKMRVHHLALCAGQCFESIMLEFTFQSMPGVYDMPVSVMTSHVATTWTRLRDVRAAHMDRGRLAADVRQDLDTIMSRLPLSWREAVDSATPARRAPWQVISTDVDGDLIVEGPDPASPTSQQLQFWRVSQLGRLQPLPLDYVPHGPLPRPRPACVVLRPKERTAWQRADYVLAASQQQLPAGQRRGVLEPWMVGVWDEMEVDPRVWGLQLHGGRLPVSLLDMRVRDARWCLQHQASMAQTSRPVPGYAQENAVIPRAWSRLPPMAAGRQEPDTDAGDLRLGLRGIAGEEELWRRGYRRHHEPLQPGDRGVDVPPIQINLTPLPERPSPEERRAARGQGDDRRTGFRAPWQRLCDPTLYRPDRVAAFRVLHVCLGCNAFLAHVHGTGDPWCTAPCCVGAREHETLTHVFLSCPDVVPVMEWLCATWRALTGVDVPASVDVLLADDVDGWMDRPATRPGLRLWTRLRVSVLGAIWRLRCDRDHVPAGQTFARTAVSMAVETFTAAMQRDWLRTHTDVRTLDDGFFCTDWWRGFDRRLTVEQFVQQWATPPIVCSVDESGGEPVLRVLISRDVPVLWPP